MHWFLKDIKLEWMGMKGMMRISFSGDLKHWARNAIFYNYMLVCICVHITKTRQCYKKKYITQVQSKDTVPARFSSCLSFPVSWHASKYSVLTWLWATDREVLTVRRQKEMNDRVKEINDILKWVVIRIQDTELNQKVAKKPSQVKTGNHVRNVSHRARP